MKVVEHARVKFAVLLLLGFSVGYVGVVGIGEVTFYLLVG